ncbi:MAG: hypothetical protein KGJ41_09330, partial [Rhodospirillales bacterium]|nr:hypothetical protein [Rhodospirillales bacterium]
APDATAAEEEAPRRFAAELPAGMPPLAGGRPDLSRPPGPHRPIGAVVAIAASVLLLAALAAAAYVWRAPIMQAWPPSARVYAVLHIA